MLNNINKTPIYLQKKISCKLRILRKSIYLPERKIFF